MTLPEHERKANIDLALRRMVAQLGDRAIDNALFDPNGLLFRDVYPTTWDDLREQGWVTVAHVFGSTRYRLTGAGWIEGLRRTGIIEKPAFRQMVARLSAILKGYVKRRKSEWVVDPKTVARDTRLPEDWIFNAIESHLVAQIFHRRDASWWEGEKGRLISVPRDFGTTPIDLARDYGEEAEELRARLQEAEEQLTEFQCPYCSAPVVEQNPVWLTDDDMGYREAFACGHEAIDGFTERACPSDPAFPGLDEFEFEKEEIPNSTLYKWVCYARPKTPNARLISFRHHVGRTAEEAYQRALEEYHRVAKPWKR